MSYIHRGIELAPDTQAVIDRYVNDGIPTGGFLQACIENDLSEACGRADQRHLFMIPAIMAYLYNETPSGCWGRAGSFDAWIARKQKEREAI